MLSAQPLQLVELKRPPNGALAAVLNTEAMKAIGELQKPVKVLAIVGAYRKGKSLILNQVLGVPSNSGFALGHKVSGETRGIWVWGKDQGDHVLLCLDTEGLGDVQNRNPEFDARLFAITLCLSSMLIVNVSTVLSEKEIADLSYVASVVRHVDTGDAKKLNAMQHFPPLVFLIRDHRLEFDADASTPDEYLKKALREVPGLDDQDERDNRTRRVIRQSFPEQRCFTLPLPVADMADLKKLTDKDGDTLLTPSFKSELKPFLAFIQKELKVKSISRDGAAVQLRGQDYVILMKNLVASINENRAFAIPDTFEAVCNSKFQQSLSEALTAYRKLMAKSAHSPMAESELHREHLRAKDESAAKLMESLVNFGDWGNKAIEEFNAMLESKDGNSALVGGAYYVYLSQNAEASRKSCAELWPPLLAKFKEACKDFPGVDVFDEARNRLEAEFRATARGPAVERTIIDAAKTFESEKELLMKRLQLGEAERAVELEKEKALQAQLVVQEAKNQADEADRQKAAAFEQLKRMQDEIKARYEEERAAMQQELDQKQEAMAKKIEEAKSEANASMEDRLKTLKAELEKRADEQRKRREEAFAAQQEKQRKQQGAKPDIQVWYNDATREYIFLDPRNPSNPQIVPSKAAQ